MWLVGGQAWVGGEHYSPIQGRCQAARGPIPPPLTPLRSAFTLPITEVKLWARNKERAGYGSEVGGAGTGRSGFGRPALEPAAAGDGQCVECPAGSECAAGVRALGGHQRHVSVVGGQADRARRVAG